MAKVKAIFWRNERGDEFKLDGESLYRKLHTDQGFNPFMGNTTEQKVEVFLENYFEGEYKRVGNA